MAQINNISMVITDACTWVDEATVHRTFSALRIGTIDKIDIVDASSRGRECKKVFIHISGVLPEGQPLCNKLTENETRQKEGELFAPIKIVYGKSRDGRDQYWKIYKCESPSERAARFAADRASKTAEFVVRIEM